MYPAGITPFLGADRVAWKAESPRAGQGKCREEYPKVPPAPPEARNRKHQEPSSHEPHEARLAHPARRLGLQSNVAQSRHQQESRNDVDVNRLCHATDSRLDDARRIAPQQLPAKRSAGFSTPPAAALAAVGFAARLAKTSEPASPLRVCTRATPSPRNRPPSERRGCIRLRLSPGRSSAGVGATCQH